MVLASVEDDVMDIIKTLVTRRNNEIHYPKFSEIKKSVEEYLEITEEDKWCILRNMNIAEEETIKKFNYRYRRSYHNLSREYQKLIIVKEYQEAISSRIHDSQGILIEHLTYCFSFLV